MPRYVFRWRCWDQPVTLVVTVDAPSDKQAGALAAAALHDFTKGRRRELRWIPETPLIETAPAR